MCVHFDLSPQDWEDIRDAERSQERYDRGQGVTITANDTEKRDFEREIRELNDIINDHVFEPGMPVNVPVAQTVTPRELAAAVAIEVAGTVSAALTRKVLTNLGERLKVIEARLGIAIPEAPLDIVVDAYQAESYQAEARRAQAYLVDRLGDTITERF